MYERNKQPVLKPGLRGPVCPDELTSLQVSSKVVNVYFLFHFQVLPVLFQSINKEGMWHLLTFLEGHSARKYVTNTIHLRGPTFQSANSSLGVFLNVYPLICSTIIWRKKTQQLLNTFSGCLPHIRKLRVLLMYYKLVSWLPTKKKPVMQWWYIHGNKWLALIIVSGGSQGLWTKELICSQLLSRCLFSYDHWGRGGVKAFISRSIKACQDQFSYRMVPAGLAWSWCELLLVQ